jgi:hypothetical protein
MQKLHKTKIKMIVKDINIYIKNYTTLKRDFKLRSSPNYTEFVTSLGKRLYFNKSDKFSKGLFLFRMVNRDIQSFLKENGQVIPYQSLPTNFTNDDFNKKNKVIGIDIDNAYWTIAFLKGYISENTFNKGISKDGLKSIRLSALSSLGKAKVYKVYEKGVYMHDEVHNQDLKRQEIYNDIRFTTYGIMYECSELLQNDFHSWKTDCIFFKDTKKNIKLVKELIESYGLSCKIEEK